MIIYAAKFVIKLHAIRNLPARQITHFDGNIFSNLTLLALLDLKLQCALDWHVGIRVKQGQHIAVATHCHRTAFMNFRGFDVENSFNFSFEEASRCDTSCLLCDESHREAFVQHSDVTV